MPHATPYVFSEDELVALLRAAGSLRPPLRGATYRALIGALAVTGMRVGEAIALDDDDGVPEDAVVVVRDGKWGKSRELVVHPSAAKALSGYRSARRRRCPRPKTAAFFVSTRGTRLHYSNVCAVFRRLTDEMGLKARPPGDRPPRLHDLRHRFAITSLLEWHRQGVDVQPRLPVLSTYLGHANPALPPYDHCSVSLPSGTPSTLRSSNGCWPCPKNASSVTTSRSWQLTRSRYL